MTIPDEAVHAAKNVMYYANPNDVERALTAAAPFLQGVKVKKLEWVDKIDSDGYINCHAKTPFGRYDVYHFKFSDRLVFGWDCAVLGIKDIDADSIEAAAQADYEARILSALEPFANSYPQGANLAAHSKNENGPDHEPSQRAHALEKLPCDVRLPGVMLQRGVKFSVLLDALKRRESWSDADRSLSQPVADGWLPIETAPKDGTEFLAWPCNTENGVIVVKAYWYVHPSIQAWITDEIDCGDFDFSPTHWRPLPASPGVSG